MNPILSILPTAQRLLWGELCEIPPEFVLFGGTAIALHLGHRVSVDFDFFTFSSFDPQQLFERLKILHGSQIVQQQKDTLTCIVERGAPVKISFFGLPKLKPLDDSLVSPDNSLAIASRISLAGTTALVVQQRAEAKDYLDVDALITSGISLPEAISAAKIIFGASYNPQLTLKALCYFNEGDLLTLPEDLKQRLARAVLTTDLSHLPELKSL